MRQPEQTATGRENDDSARPADVTAPRTAATRLAADGSRHTARGKVLWAATAVVLAVAAAYANSFQGDFLFDDLPSISGNRTIRHLWHIETVLSPPAGGETVSGRPLLNFSLAVNYALGGMNVWGYHALNLAIHILAALVLLGILRRTFALVDGGWLTVDGRGPAEHGQWSAGENIHHPPSTVHRPPSTLLALTITLLWALHPLQTESVTYVIQRAQSMAGLFYLLVVYCVIRGAASKKATVWYLAAVVACLLGMASKETMVTAPLLVLLYDRTFLAGSFLQALRRRWGLYLALGATWGLLAGLVLSTGLLGRRAEFDSPDSWSYACTQPGVILHYLRLCVWPHPLCFQYHWPMARTAGAILPAALVVAALLAATVWGLAARKPWAFLPASFFLLLAPTSSVVPLGGAACEHWMYLPLAPLVTWLVLIACRAGKATLFRGGVANWAPRAVAGCLVLLAAFPLGILTSRRNADYRDAISLWEDTVAKAPDNERAYNNLGTAMAARGRLDDAIAQFRKAVELCPDYSMGHSNLGAALNTKGDIGEGIRHCQWALRLNPNNADARYNLGVMDAAQGRLTEAITQFRRALELRPDYADAHDDLGNVLVRQGRFDEAVAQYRQSVEIQPDDPAFHYNLAGALAQQGKLAEAIEHFQQALEIDPANAGAHHNLGVILCRQGKTAPALAHWREALRLQPAALDTLNKLAWVLATHSDASLRNGAEAVDLAQQAAQLSGSRDPAILDTLAAAYAGAGRFAAAIETARRALALARAHQNTTLADRIQGRIDLYRSAIPYREALPSQ